MNQKIIAENRKNELKELFLKTKENDLKKNIVLEINSLNKRFSLKKKDFEKDLYCKKCNDFNKFKKIRFKTVFKNKEKYLQKISICECGYEKRKIIFKF